MKKDLITRVLVFVFVVAIVIAITASTPLVLMWAWNYLAASVLSALNLPEITFWQSLAVVVVLGVIRTALFEIARRD